MSKTLTLTLSIGFLTAACTPQTTDFFETNSNQARPTNANIPIIQQQPTNTNQSDSSMSDSPVSDTVRAIIKTSHGSITVAFYGQDSPKTVNNFLKLAEEGFYDGTKFHRVIQDFMIQGGDPNSKTDNTATWGTGDPGYKFEDEFNQHKLVRGSLAMANSGPNTNGSQFFIVTAEATPWLDGRHTNFGYVVEGIEVIEAIEAVKTTGPDRPVEPVVVQTIEIIR